MKFEEKFKDKAENLEDPIKLKHEGRCGWCFSYTNYRSLTYNVYVCSDECLTLIEKAINKAEEESAT